MAPNSQLFVIGLLEATESAAFCVERLRVVVYGAHSFHIFRVDIIFGIVLVPDEFPRTGPIVIPDKTELMRTAQHPVLSGIVVRTMGTYYFKSIDLTTYPDF